MGPSACAVRAFWDLNCSLSPALPGCSHLEFQSLFYNSVESTGKITEAIHKKRNIITSVWHYRAWSLPFPHFTFCILDDFTPSMKHRSTVTAALPWCANTIQGTFFPCHFLLLKHFCSTSELLMLPGLWYIVIFFLQESCHHFYSLFKLNFVLIKGPGRLFSYPLWESIPQNI